MKFTVSPNEDKKRLDHVLAKRFPSISRSFLQSLCKTNQILVNNQPQKSGYTLRWSDTVEVTYDMDSIGVVPEIDMPILYEDDSVLVIDKPAGVLSHALSKFKNESSVASFLRQRTSNDKTSENIRYGIVHRLDRATSGVMVCAKDKDTAKFLQKQFSDRSVSKTYVAVSVGTPKEKTAVINVPIERNPKAPATFRPGNRGKSAETSYQVISATDKYSLISLHPKTGRTHQLRVHLAYINCPIVGDQLYGDEEANRLYLHAHELTVQVPGEESKTFTSSIPASFNQKMKES